MVKTKSLYACYACTYPQETFMEIPLPISTILYRKKSQKSKIYKGNSSHIRIKYIKKFSNGKFGDVDNPTIFDFIYYAFRCFCNIIEIRKQDGCFFIAPPYFDCLIIPFLRKSQRKYIYVMDAQSETSLTKNASFIKKIYYFFAEKLACYSVKNANLVFVLSQYLRKKYALLNKNIVVVPMGADVKTIAKIKPKRYFKEKTITYLGGFQDFRGLPELLDAFEIIHKKMKIKLLLIGNGPTYDAIKKKSKSNRDVQMMGFMDHDKAIALCKGSDILVMPARDEPASYSISSLKCFEYIACEKPSVVTNTGDHAFYTLKLGTGLVCKPSPEDIARACIELLHNQELYSQICANCKKNKSEIDFVHIKRKISNAVISDLSK